MLLELQTSLWLSREKDHLVSTYYVTYLILREPHNLCGRYYPLFER